jgi:hypothetical protein
MQIEYSTSTKDQSYSEAHFKGLSAGAKEPSGELILWKLKGRKGKNKGQSVIYSLHIVKLSSTNVPAEFNIGVSFPMETKLNAFMRQYDDGE